VGETFDERPATLAGYLAILRRRKWIVIQLPVIAAVVAYALSTSQSPLYRANAQVLFDQSNIPAALSNISPVSVFGDPATYMATQASIARSPALAQGVVKAAGVPGETAGGFLGQSSANARAASYILELSASASNADDAVRLVNAYADEFTRYKAQLATKTIEDQLARIKLLIARGSTGGSEHDFLLEQKLALETLGGQLAHNSSVLQHAEGAAKTRPRPLRNGILGGLLGAVLALGLAFLAETLDRRTRSEQEVEEVLGVPLLGRVPRPERPLRDKNELVMIAEPMSVHAETFRKMRTSLEFVNSDRGARTIMVTSAVQREGKSTTVANLAVALARTGRRVALVDLDLRQPFLHVFFDVGHDHGFTDVVVNRVDLDRAIRPIAFPAVTPPGEDQTRNGHRGLSGANGPNGRPDAECIFHLLPSGTIPPAADEILEREQVSTVLEDLSTRYDVVLVDAPPLLAVGDALTLSAKVDAILVVAHLGIDRRQLREFARQLQNCKAAILGFILTGVAHGDSHTYGYGYGPHVSDVRREAERPSRPRV
jgi:polysaccharide biosynthesis transport protein